MQSWLNGMKKTYCKKIGYAQGYAPPPGQDPRKTTDSTGAATTTGQPVAPARRRWSFSS
jgi:hypothetical protein